MIDVFLKCISGIDDIKETVAGNISGEQLYELLMRKLPTALHNRSNITLVNGTSIRKYDDLRQLTNGKSSGFIDLQLRLCLCGGKGGLGSQLKAEGNRVSKRRGNNNEVTDQLRTLEGRRVKTIKKAKQLEEVLSKRTELEKQELEQKRKKLLAIVNSDPMKNIKFDDTQYLETSEKMLEEIRDSLQFNLNSDSESDEIQKESEITGTSENMKKSFSKKKTGPSSRFASFFGDLESESDSEDDLKTNKESG